MILFDRYTDKEITEKELPDQIDFGRYFFKEKNSELVELTYSVFSTNKFIKQEILLDKNRSLQDVFIDIGIDIKNSPQNKFEVVPLIKRIKNKLGLNEFESMLNENIFHLEEIFRQPHYLLEREIEKVHVSRAKRIPSKSYQHLASHTEDWAHKSIVNFKPIRILNEELNLNFDIYENELTIIFLERCLIYLNSRLKEIQDIESFLDEYKKILQNKSADYGWYKKNQRNFHLIGAVYEDDHNLGKSSDNLTLSKTEEVLNQINKRLLVLRNSDLFLKVNKKASKSILLRNTNVLINHKHYRFVKALWIELNKVNPEKNDKETVQYEQDIFKGIRSFAISLLVYCLKEYLNYQLEGNYNSFTGRHEYFPSVSFALNTNQIGHFKVGTQNLKIVFIGNEPLEIEILSNTPMSQKTCILFFSEEAKKTKDRVININPLDPDSCERIGSFLRKYIIKNYLEKINKEYKYAQLLRDYVHLFPQTNILFDKDKYSYKFISYPTNNIIISDIEKNLVQDETFKSIKSRDHKERVQKELIGLANEINTGFEKLKSEFLHCVACSAPLNFFVSRKFDHIVCGQCHMLLNNLNQEKVIFKNAEHRYQSLNPPNWGMDFLNFNVKEL